MDSWQSKKQYVEVLGHRMAYVEEGSGPPIVLLHGNPTSSYLWRAVIPELAGRGRCIVPDLIGMGDSDKLPAEDANRYTFVRHSEFLDAFLDAVGVGDDVTLVVHDWGSALGFDWAHRHSGRVRGIAYMEALVRPFDGWKDWSDSVRPVFEGFRSPAGEKMILEDNMFVEAVLPASVLRDLTPDEMAEYRRPFGNAGEDRLPTLVFPRELPFAGDGTDASKRCAAYADWLANTPGLPKLFINCEPGAILTGSAA